MKSYDKDAIYTVAFKDEEARRSAWIKLHCMISAPGELEMGGKSESERIQYLKRRMGIAYQIMTLYLDCETVFSAEELAGQEYGGFLNYIAELDKDALKYIEIKKQEG